MRLFTLMSRAGTWSGRQVGFRTSFVLASFHMVTYYLSHSPVKELEYCFLNALIKHIFSVFGGGFYRWHYIRKAGSVEQTNCI